MATITGFTAERMLAIENSTVVDGEIDGDDLVLLTRDGTPINAGSVRGIPGPIGPSADVADFKWSLRTTIPGWIPLNGVPVVGAETLYPGLWPHIPAAWKSGSNFTPPDMTDVIVQGGGTVGALTGANTRAIVSANLPPHVHTMPHHQHSVPAHSHTMAHVHSHAHTHPGASLNIETSITTAARTDSSPGTGFSLMAASGSGGSRIQTSNPTAESWATGSTGSASVTNTSGSSAPNTGSGGGGTSGSGGAGDTGNGPGTSTPFDVQQRALRLNAFIYAGVD